MNPDLSRTCLTRAVPVPGKSSFDLRMGLLALLLSLFQPPSLQATTVIPPSFDDLVTRAEIIFEGQVTAVESRWAGQDETRRIMTYYTFQVLDVLKGQASSPYVLEILGGTVGDTTLKVEGAPQFQTGEQVILFVTNNGKQIVPLVGFMHGYYRFQHEMKAGRSTVVKHDGEALRDVGDIGKEQPVEGGRLGKFRAQNAPASPPMSPQSFKDKIRARKQQMEP